MANMIPISTVTVGSGGAATIDFTNIPQIYTDLKIVVSARNVASNVAGGVWLYPNGSTSNMSARVLFGTGSASGSTTDTKIWGYANSANSTSSTFGNIEFYIPNYTSSNNKSISVDGVMENNATEGRQNLSAGLWSNTAPITSIALESFNNSTSAVSNFAQYSSATLYGIRKY